MIANGRLELIAGLDVGRGGRRLDFWEVLTQSGSGAVSVAKESFSKLGRSQTRVLVLLFTLQVSVLTS